MYLSNVAFMLLVQYLLGQCMMKHVLFSMLSPMQSSPPYCGGGDVQLRALSSVPLPQVILHADQSLQEDQLPATTPVVLLDTTIVLATVVVRAYVLDTVP